VEGSSEVSLPSSLTPGVETKWCHANSYVNLQKKNKIQVVQQ
jgi:hypothetical protein